MEYLTTHLLFNLALLIVLLFLCFMWVKRFKGFQYYKKTALFYCIASIVLCFLFSYRISDSIVLDLRMVPYVIGALYMRFSPILGLLIIFLRAIHGIDYGFYFVLCYYGLFGIISWFISPWFLRQRSNHRILISTCFTILSSISLIIYLEVLDQSYLMFDFFIAFLIVLPIGVAMLSFIIEMIEKYHLLYQQVLKTEKLEAVEQMGAAISHEILNPLTSAIGFTQLLDEESVESRKKIQYLSIIKGELEAAEQVIKDYLTFSKPQIESVEKLNVNEELFRLLKFLEPLANINSVKLLTKFSAKVYLDGDRQKFQQCFINILRNVIESLPNGGDVLIETECTQKNIFIIIKDSGLGMSKSSLKRLGEPYYLTNGKKGTGLGIMVAYSIVRAMGGTIDVKSEIGIGTTFRFSFNRIT
ncbi:ATP-binding protein [Lederbergia wuyishanensis]|uniref:histidine kinase n=1 Tax=Lederbergia wuyishanensis TaxID=1347903 RepID=A0ABU0D532_9BACI|nr:HAMP domain-containing sensor histidine kinase [Lederbergia wuyishanensis]MCJ8009593.1 HAMP domain-containing histidine kinase [Lederbergia wuyishanensis]MDQ0343499.1 two-component system sporulation sensor kinase B [Lederbergia wuyishanensis]